RPGPLPRHGRASCRSGDAQAPGHAQDRHRRLLRRALGGDLGGSRRGRGPAARGRLSRAARHQPRVEQPHGGAVRDRLRARRGEARAMILDKDVAVPMRDGAVLRCNVFRPETPGRYPVLMTLGPYGKDVHLSQFMPEAWEALKRRHPEILEASSCKYLVFETPDPETWVREGYVVVK